MTNAFKKIYLAITSMLMVVTVQVNGTDCSPISYCEPENCNFNFRGELLYWRPELCSLESAFGSTTIATTVNGGIITTTVTEVDEEPDSKWSPGFRIGADMAFDCFDLELDWTHFNGRASFREDEQHGHWKIRYDVIDLTIGRNLCFGSCFYLKPFIGLRGARIHQTLKSHLETLFTSIIGNNVVFTDQDDKEDFWGLGPQIGLEADWYLGCDFSLYGSITAVTYYGHARSRSFDTDTFTSTVSICNGKKKHCFNNIATDAEIGIRWNKTVCCSCYEMDVMLKLGLEQHRIWEFSQLGSHGTLSLDGGIFAAGVGYRY